MTVLYLEALTAIAVSLSILMAGAWLVQQRTGNSGWVDTIWTFSLGLVGAGSALWPVAGGAANGRQWLGRGPVAWRAVRPMRGNGWSRPWWRSGRCGSARISPCARPALPTIPVMPRLPGIGA